MLARAEHLALFSAVSRPVHWLLTQVTLQASGCGVAGLLAAQAKGISIPAAEPVHMLAEIGQVS
jgi:hypothetical protein